MTNEKKEKMGFTPDGWEIFVRNIADEYGDGKLIRHDWLREQFGFKELHLQDYESVSEFLKARDIQQWAYADAVETLRWELLKTHKMFFRNVFAEGYEILHPEDQTQYAYDEFLKDIKKAIRVANLVMSNVQPVDLTQQAKDNDLRAKFGIMRQMLASVK